MPTIFDQIGVYAIENSADGRIYIGSTRESFNRRWRLHKRHLRQGIHDNHFLQRAWNKYGDIAFAFRVLEVVDDPAEILAAEQRWIDHYRAQGTCYNLAPTAGSNAGLRWSDESRQRASKSAKQRTTTPAGQQHLSSLAEAHAKTYPGLIDPNGTVYAPITNMQAFCRTHQLDRGAIQSVITGIVKRHKGWTRYDGRPVLPADQRLAHANAKTYTGFVAPDGTVYRNITNLSAFCREHGLSQASMSHVARGRNKVHRGWRAVSPDEDQVDQ